MEVGRVFHWGPLIALTIIFSISTSSIVCDLMWWPISTTGGLIHFIIYVIWMYLTLYYFLGAMYTGPGHVPYDWMPVS
jgi:palmitoyltransferase